MGGLVQTSQVVKQWAHHNSERALHSKHREGLNIEMHMIETAQWTVLVEIKY